MYFMAAPVPVSPPTMGLPLVPMHFSTPMKDATAAASLSMGGSGFSVPGSGPVLTAAPPSYEAIVLDPNGPRSQTNLFVRKLASAVTEEDMRRLFDQHGTIMSFALMRDIHTGESLGTAFVRYSTHDEARRAMAALDGRELYGRPISIQWAKREHDSAPSGDARRKIRKLFVRNIPLDVTARHLRQLFAKFGAINNVTLHSDTAPAAVNRDLTDTVHPASHTRNIAFILFQEDDVAEKAVSALHNSCPFETCEGIPLMVKLAEDNRDRIDRKQRFSESTVATPGSKALGPAIMMPGRQLSMAAVVAAVAGSSMSPHNAPLSTPASAAVSPSTTSIDANNVTPLVLHDGSAPPLPQSTSSGLPFAIAGGAPAATATPLLHASVDANGNPTYVFLGPSGPSGMPPTIGAASAAGAPSMPYVFQPCANGGSGLPAPQPGPPAYPTAATIPTAMQPFYPTMTMPPMFVDAQGRPVQGPQMPPPQLVQGAAQSAAGMFIPNYLTGFAGAQARATAPLPMFSMPVGALAHPLQAPTSLGSSQSKSGSTAPSFHIPSPVQSQPHTLPAMMTTQPTFSASPQLSSAGSLLERVATAGGGPSNSDSPVTAGLTAAFMASQLPAQPQQQRPQQPQQPQQRCQPTLTITPQSFLAGTPPSGAATIFPSNLSNDVRKSGLPNPAAATLGAVGAGAAAAPAVKEARLGDDDEAVWSNFAARALAASHHM